MPPDFIDAILAQRRGEDGFEFTVDGQRYVTKKMDGERPMLTDDEIKALRDGCKNGTPGPWTSYPGDRFESAFVRGPDGHVVAWDQTPADAAHIARCDPTTIAELCTRLLSAQAKVLEGFAKQALAHFEVQERISKKYGLGPGQLQSQWRDGKRTDTRELEDAICDALAMGGIAAWSGDGVGCAAQIVTGYSKAIARERDEARARVKVLEDALEDWQAAVVIDVLMEGPRYQGVRGSLGREAWEKARKVLEPSK
jgi:hypothetical protein